MNTQTHLLLGVAVLAQTPAPSTPVRVSVLLVSAILLGGIVPDASLFFMWGYAKVLGIADSTIWSDWYYSTSWQTIGAISNSLPLFGALAILAYYYRRRQSSTAGNLPSTDISWPALLLLFSLAALLHIAMDFPLHNDDGRPHFWPLSDWIFASPVSYWDTDHHATLWQPVELLIAAVCSFVIWRRSRFHSVRVLIVLVLMSYAAMSLYWMQLFG